MNENLNEKKGLMVAGVVLLGVLALFLLVQTINGIKTYGTIGSDAPATNVISVSGTGDVFAVADKASFTFTVSEEATTPAEAKDKAAVKANKAIDYIKGQGVAEKDIKTIDYSLNPKYENHPGTCTINGCSNNSVIVGYTLSETFSVDLTDQKKAGDILSGVINLGIQQTSQLTFKLSNEDDLKDQARELAIKNAEAKAQKLARQLGVKLVRITSFSEQGGGYYPMYDKAMSASAPSAAPAPELPQGQNKITSNVTISYEIR